MSDDALEQAQEKIRTLKREIDQKDRALHARNVALDGMAWVWCDGGCKAGTGRFSDIEITEEMVRMIEANTKRLRTWLTNRNYRANYATLTPTYPSELSPTQFDDRGEE